MSDRVRIYELARKMNLPAPTLIDACRELGYDVKSHSSTIDGHVVGLVIAHLGKKKQAPEKPEPKAAAAPAAKASTTGTTKTAAKTAAPPAPVVKPRVLARYRKEPVVEAAEVVVEPPVQAPPPPAAEAPIAAAPPVVEKPVEKLPPPLEQPIPQPAPPLEQPIPQPAAPAAPVVAKAAPEPEAPPPPIPSAPAPAPVSKAVLEQRAQMEAIERAAERAKRERAEQEALQTAKEEAVKNAKREAEAARGRGDRTQKKEVPKEEGDLHALRDTLSTRPMTPSSPAQPIRIAAPSFRATPPRPPKSHHRQPQERHLPSTPKKEDKRQAAAVVEVPQIVAIVGPLTVKELAEKMAQPETEIIKRLFMKGVMRTVNQLVEPDLSKELAVEMGYELASQEDIDIAALVAAEEAGPKKEVLTEAQIAALVTRPPVVTIMGHVDHGKTSLLDAIRQTKFLLTDAEHGGITQHIGAYHVEIPAEDGSLRQIVFLDTPGHEAFTAMRARGAKVTDIAILVVAADDGVMPQTIEAIDHAKAAGVPLIVAINKIDKSDAEPDRVLTDLMKHGVVPDKFGGDTVTVNVSAKKRIGLDELLEMILLVADVQDLKADPERPATGSIVEAELSRGKGAVATALVANGTLREGDCIVAGSAWGRVRALFDDRGERVKAAGPSMPVEVLGLKEVPQAGDRFEVVQDEQTARALAEQRKEQEVDVRKHHVTLESFHDMMASGEVKELDIIVKADVQGTAEAIADQLTKLSAKEVSIRVLRTASGDISETDVNLAASSNAIIIGFNVQPDNNARSAAETAGVDIRSYNIIYQIIDDLQLAMQGLLQPIRREVEVGTAEIRQLFKSKNLTVAGCMVTSGKIPRGAIARIEREGATIYEGKLDSLKRFKDDAKEVASGFECGMSFERFNDVKEGDIVHAFSITEEKRQLTR
jgi:translation initiation factor IF-2